MYAFIWRCCCCCCGAHVENRPTCITSHDRSICTTLQSFAQKRMMLCDGEEVGHQKMNSLGGGGLYLVVRLLDISPSLIYILENLKSDAWSLIDPPILNLVSFFFKFQLLRALFF